MQKREGNLESWDFKLMLEKAYQVLTQNKLSRTLWYKEGLEIIAQPQKERAKTGQWSKEVQSQGLSDRLASTNE